MSFRYGLFTKWIYRLYKRDDGIFRKVHCRAYLDALQLNSNTLLFFDGAVLGLGELVGQSHILQLQMFHNTNLSHLSSLRGTKQHKRRINSRLTNDGEKRATLATTLPAYWPFRFAVVLLPPGLVQAAAGTTVWPAAVSQFQPGRSSFGSAGCCAPAGPVEAGSEDHPSADATRELQKCKTKTSHLIMSGQGVH